MLGRRGLSCYRMVRRFLGVKSEGGRASRSAQYRLIETFAMNDGEALCSRSLVNRKGIIGIWEGDPNLLQFTLCP